MRCGARSGGAAALLSMLLVAYAANATTTESYLILLDASGSITAEQRDRALKFSQLFVTSHPGCEFAMDLFGERIEGVVDYGTPDSLVEIHLDTEAIRSRTVLYDAIFEGSARLAGRQTGRKAILLFSDGKDTSSDLLLEDCVRHCLDAGIPVFTFGIGSRITDKPLRRISKLTGGQYSVLPNADELETVLAAVDENMPVPKVIVPVAATELPEPARPESRAPGDGRPAQPRSDSGDSTIYLAVGVALLAGCAILALVLMRRRKEARPQCPKCGLVLESFFSECPNCRISEPPPLPQAAAEPVEDEPPPLSDDFFPRRAAAERADESTVVMLETPVLVVKRGKSLGAVYPVPWCGSLNIGRSRSNSVIVDDRTASAEHCLLKHDGERFIVYDLKSTNGTFLNEHKVVQAFVKDGDLLQVGETQLLFKVQRLSA